MSIFNTAYAPPDGGVGDFCPVKTGDGWHFFYIHREYSKGAKCNVVGQETKIGHAFSKDLLQWETRAPAIVAREGCWDSAHVWAPTVVRHEGLWYMLYTGMKEDINQKIGVAVSKDLENWSYPCAEPVIDTSRYGWTEWSSEGYTHCRDPYLFRRKDEWLCYYTAAEKGWAPVTGVAASKDLIHWEDRGWVLKTQYQNGEGRGTEMIESPCVFEAKGKIFLTYTQGFGIRYVVSEDPFDFRNAPVQRLQDGIYNFEILDTETGLFAYANLAYYSCLRFGCVGISHTDLQFPGDSKGVER